MQFRFRFLRPSYWHMILWWLVTTVLLAASFCSKPSKWAGPSHGWCEDMAVPRANTADTYSTYYHCRWLVGGSECSDSLGQADCSVMLGVFFVWLCIVGFVAAGCSWFSLIESHALMIQGSRLNSLTYTQVWHRLKRISQKMEYHWNHFSQPNRESFDHLSSCVAEVDGGHQPPLESELPALDERASVPAAPAPGHCGGLQGGEGRKCEEVVAGRDWRVTLLRGRFLEFGRCGRIVWKRYFFVTQLCPFFEWYGMLMMSRWGGFTNGWVVWLCMLHSCKNICESQLEGRFYGHVSCWSFGMKHTHSLPLTSLEFVQRVPFVHKD